MLASGDGFHAETLPIGARDGRGTAAILYSGAEKWPEFPWQANGVHFSRSANKLCPDFATTDV